LIKVTLFDMQLFY